MLQWGRVCLALSLIASGPPLAAVAPTVPPVAPSRFETDVLAALNAARTDPLGYVAGLQTYRGYFHAKIVVVPGAAEHFETAEGVAPVDEAIAFLKGHPPLALLEPASLLALGAADHVADQSVSGRTGHYGSDHSTPGDRAVRRGGGKGIAEVIAYGASDAADVIRQLIIDDGVSDRGHRVLMFSEKLRYAGVSCGTHPEFRMMCVIDMAETPDGRAGTGRPVKAGAVAVQR